MIRYRLPHNFHDDYSICIDCGTTYEQIEDGKKSRYCRKNRNHKSGRPSFSVWNMSKYRIVEELIEEGLYGSLDEITDALVASIIDDIASTETRGMRAAYEKAFEEAMLHGSSAVVHMPGRIHEADAPGLVEFKGLGFLEILRLSREEIREKYPQVSLNRDMFSFFDDKPPQQMPIPNYMQDPDTWYIKGSPEELAKLNLKVYDPFRYKIRERTSFEIAPPAAVVKVMLTDDELAAIKTGSFVAVDGEPEKSLITSREISAEEHCKWFCAWNGGGPCRADDCPRRAAT